MLEELLALAARFWASLRANDLPNWVATAFALVVWPLVLVAWQQRRVNSIPGLEVHFYPGSITISDKPFPAIDVRFTNHTGSVVYVSGMRIQNCSSLFPVPTAAARDVSSNSYHMKFNYGDGAFIHREVTLQTDGSAQTCMPVLTMPADRFFTHVRPWYARLLRQRRYFVVEDTALVGNTRHRVAMRY
jgi:hypothetical protein